MACYLCSLLPQHTGSQSNHEQITSEGHSAKYLTSPPQNCQGHQKQGKSKKWPKPRDMMTTSNDVSGWDPGTEGHQIKAREIQINGELHNKNLLILGH